MDSVKVDYSKRYTIDVEPVVGFDWYATGYCISHFDEIWGLILQNVNNVPEENIDLLVKGLRSSSIAKARILSLNITGSSLSVIITLKEFCRLKKLVLWRVNIDHDDLVILQQLIAPGSELKYLFMSGIGLPNSSSLILTLFQPSSLQQLGLEIIDTFVETQLLPHGNTNLKKLAISSDLLHPLAALIVNITSLTYLEIDDPLSTSDLPVLTNIVQSHHTLEVLQIEELKDYTDSTNLLQLIEAADSNEHVLTFKLDIVVYNKLPPHIQEQYKQLLKPC